jgi:hypothetical protein
MSDPILRPIFFDGQILNAGNLGDAVNYARNQLARHERCLHSWGIASGFNITTAPKTTASGTNYVEVTVSDGVAIDALGRELVLTPSQVLDPTEFVAAHVYDPSNPKAWYPVCIQGISVQQPAPSAFLGACAAAGQSTTQGEGVQFIYLAPGGLNDSTPNFHAADPPDTPAGGQPWKILIGFVQWDPGASQFTAAQRMNDQNVSRRLAGVQAARVEARDGNLLLQTSGNAPTKLMLAVQEAVGNTPGSMTFGPDDGKGGVTPLLQIDTKGNLSVSGQITSNLPPGSTRVQSGIATDGMLLPLPPGLTDDDVSAGNVLLHIQVTPIVPDTPPPGAKDAMPPSKLAVVPLACYVDGSRRVWCRLRYMFNVTANATADVAGTCQYTVVATPAAGGTSS